MADLFTAQNLMNLLVIFALEMVLGFDNLLYISIESRRAPLGQQERARKVGLVGAVVLRVILLYVTVQLIAALSAPIFTINESSDPNSLMIPGGWISGSFNFSVIVFLLGGAFLMYTALKEIAHLLSIDDIGHEKDGKTSSFAKVVTSIMIMNLVFSFDSTLTALAISDVFLVQAFGVIGSGVVMYLIAEPFTKFITKNRMFEVVGLFVLFIVGVSLLGEGGHEGHLILFGHPIEPLAKSTFYFSIAVLFIVELVQSRYQRKLDRERELRLKEVNKA